MKILHILNDGPSSLSDEIINEQSRHNEVKVIDLSGRSASYESIIDDIASFDRVISW